MPKPVLAEEGAPMIKPVVLYTVGVLTASTLLSIGLAAVFGPETASGLAVLGMAAPAIVALLVELLVVRRDGADRASLARVFATRTDPRRLGIGLVVTVLAIMAALGVQLLVGAALGWIEYRLPDDIGALTGAIGMQFAIMLVASTGEELGWRGWLHTRLRRAGLGVVMVVTAVVWVLFHVPFLAVTGALSPAEWVTTLGSIAAVSILFTALRERFESVWPAVVGHALLNSVVLGVQSGFTSAPAGSAAGLPFTTLICAGFLIAAVLVLRVGRRAPTVEPVAIA